MFNLEFPYMFPAPLPTIPSGTQMVFEDNKTGAQCRNCHVLRPTAMLKMCGNCKLPPTEEYQSLIRNQYIISSAPWNTYSFKDFNFYYCDRVCQKLHWKTHKLVCGQFKHLHPEPSPIDKSVSSDLFKLVKPPLNRNQLPWGPCEDLLEEWCEFNQHLLVYTVLQALDLIRNPQNSIHLIFTLVLKLNEDHPRVMKLISMDENQDDDGNKGDTKQSPKSKKTEKPIQGEINRIFQVERLGPQDHFNFYNANSYHRAADTIHELRRQIQYGGGIGAATLMVRCDAIAAFFPIVLTTQDFLNSIPIISNWRELFDEAIESGKPWKMKNQPKGWPRLKSLTTKSSKTTAAHS